MVDPLAGVLISTRYRLIGQLGSGGTDIVWDARDEQLNLAVAIKELRPPEPAPQRWLAEMLQLLKAEARYTGQLTHQSIVAVYDVVSDLDRPWIIMPRVTGRSLAAEIAAGGTWDPARTARLALHLIQALEATHAEGVAHGAVKPSNVLIPEFGVPMLTDFSLAPSPHEADLLGLGATLYFAVEGDLPRSTEPEPPQNASLITEVVEGLLTADPGQRLTLAQAREQLTAAVAEFAAQRRKAQLSQGVNDTPTEPASPAPAPASTAPTTSSAHSPGLAATTSTRTTDAPSPGATASQAVTPPGFAALPTPSHAATSPLPGSPTASPDPVAKPKFSAFTPVRSTTSPVPGHATAASPADPPSAPPGFVAAQPAPAPSVAVNVAMPPEPAAAPPAARHAMAPPTSGPPAVRTAPAFAARRPAAAVVPTAPGPVAASLQADTATVGAFSVPEEPEEPAPGGAVAAPNRRRLNIAAAVALAVVAVVAATFAFLRLNGTGQAPAQLVTVSPAVRDTTAPQQPVNVTVSGRSTDTVTLVWDAGIDDVGVTEYRVQRDGVQVGTTATPDYTDKGLAVNTTYGYTLTAVDAAGNISAASAAVTAITLKVPDTTKPSTPGNLRITGRSTTSIILGWTAATDDVGVARYQVRRDGRTIATPAAARYTDTSLAPGTSHSYVVVAVDASGNLSDPTAPVTGVTLTVPDTAPPSAPGTPHVTGTTTTTISLAWTASSDNTGVTNYRVYRNGILVASPTALAYTDPGLTPGTTYAYQVKAVDGAGNVSAAAAISAATVAPQVSGINAAVTVGALPACTVTITATVAVTAGPVTVDLQVIINGATSTRSLSFPGPGSASQVVDIGTASGTQDGTVQVSSTSPNPVSSTKTWTAPDACRPGFTVSSPTAQADSCGSPTISGSVRITARNNPGPEQYTVQMLVDGNKVDETTITLAPNNSVMVGLTSAPDPYPNGTYAVSYMVIPQSGSSATSSTVNAEVNC